MYIVSDIDVSVAKSKDNLEFAKQVVTVMVECTEKGIFWDDKEFEGKYKLIS